MWFLFPCSARSGFTLIELSIVLVIIALIVGPILTGQSLIQAAQIRATISQLEKYNTAVNTFRDKYNGVPGDLTPQQSTAFGFFSMTGALAGQRGYQDGNGLIEGDSLGDIVCSGEELIFWRHLSDAGLIDGTFGSMGNNAIVANTGAVTADTSRVGQSLPASMLSPNYFVAFAYHGTNYFQLGPWPVVDTNGFCGSGVGTGHGLTPSQAYAIDAKMDDGMPNTGGVLADGADGPGWPPFNKPPTWAQPSTAGNCLMGGTSVNDPSDTYNTIITFADTPSCSLAFRFN